MNWKNFLAQVKVYAYFYLVTAPFTYLAYKVGDIRPADDFITLNIFVALSLWLYIKKIQPLINEPVKITGTKILLFFLVALATLFSIKSETLSSEIESEVSSIESTVSSIESEILTLQDDASNLKDEIEELRTR